MHSGSVCLCVLMLAQIASAQQPAAWAAAMRQGQALQNDGRFAEAELRFQSALRQAAQLPGREDLQAIALSDLASVDLDLGHLDKAVSNCQRAIALLVRTVGASDPRVQTLRAELAAFYLESGQAGTAEGLLRGIVSSPATAPSADRAFVVDVLACLYARENKLARAEEAERQSLSVLEALPRPDNRSLAVGYVHLAIFLNSAKRPADALPYAEHGLTLLQTLPAPQPVMQASAEASLASIHAALGRHEEAEGESARALQVTESFYGPDHPQTAWMLLARAAMLRRLDRKAAAKELQSRADRILQANRTARLDETVPLEALLPARK